MMSHRLSVYILMLGLLTGCGLQERVKFHEERAILGTFVQIDICAKKREGAKADRAFKDVWARFEDINLRMNAYNPESEVARLHGYKTGENVQVSADILEVIALSRKVSIETGGLFDITVRPLIDVWNRAGELKKEPAYQEIVSAGLKTGSELIELVDERTIRFLYPGMEIDLGGVAKGYAVDEAARILRSHGFKDFFIDAGGDVYAAGLNLKGEHWRIGIQHPRKKDELLDILSISDQAVTTSGDYERFVEIDGKHYSHIIDPRTGYPQVGNISATVIAPSAMEADAYSTALMIWDPQAGIACLDGLGEGFAALVIAEGDGGPQFFSSREYRSVQSEPKNLSF
ncbi:MAG TPA: FAD:protein FMN transferase [Candidatus Omnitrophota bacterium]|nr:FAD:protein FMN transferase [Candidatus Omnitrophota bacterium]